MQSLLTFFPPFVIFLWYAMVHKDGSIAKFLDFYKQNELQGFLRICPKPTLVAWKLNASYAGFEAELQFLLPGKRVEGPISPKGNVLIYKANGVISYVVTLVTYIAIWWLGLFNPLIVYDHLGEIFLSLIIGSFIFCILLYIKGHVAPSSTDSGS